MILVSILLELYPRYPKLRLKVCETRKVARACFTFLLNKKKKEHNKKKITSKIELSSRDVDNRKCTTVMVTLDGASWTPLVKMEALVKLCAESLHYVLLGLCTR